jgi:hypothetical protein
MYLYWGTQLHRPFDVECCSALCCAVFQRVWITMWLWLGAGARVKPCRSNVKLVYSCKSKSTSFGKEKSTCQAVNDMILRGELAQSYCSLINCLLHVEFRHSRQGGTRSSTT